ncbi:MAG TPA: Zn-dependent hydrolase [Gemmatimonadales bacterium]|nr:Zn-dependent hydrolase [Gemmatimonadales bacterium]
MDRRDFARALAAVPALRLGLASPGQDTIRVDGERLNRNLAALAAHGRTPAGTNRVAYTEADLAGREFVMGLMREAGLAVRIDTGGNILGRREGTARDLPVILIGSHIDSVTDGGNYDGDVGSLGAIEVAHTLADRRLATRHPLEVVIFQNEEGGTIGSKMMAAGLTEAELDRTARSGKTIREGTRFLGGDPARLAEARRKPGDLLCYFELHIEQGGILDEAGIRIGVVEGIVGIRWYEVEIRGFANHAGTTPMDRRKDAMLAAAKLTVAVNQIVRSVPGRQVGTVGRLVPVPGTVNVIPGQVTMTIDLRDLSVETLALMSRRFETAAREIAAETGTTIAFRELSTNEPAFTDRRLRRVIAESAERLGLSTREMPSGAGHDAQEIARIAPMGMIFVPSVRGISHSPEELSRPQDIANGADVLLHSVLAVDRRGLAG